MRERRFLFNCVLICLPAAALCAFGLYFLFVEVPRIQVNERTRATRVYRRFAEELAARPASDEGLSARPEGWRQTGRIVQGAQRFAWGHVPVGDSRRVWVDDGARTRFVDVETVGFPAIGAWLTGLIAAILPLFVAGTVCCLRFFILFARERDDFLAATAHDLTTPLVGMRHLIGRSDEEVRRLNERLLRLVANITDFLRLGGRRPPPRRDTFTVGAAFDAAYRLFADDYADEVSGPVAVSGDPSLAVCADETLVVQILWNLLGNDLKYAAPYGPVRAVFSATDDEVRVALLDEGQGMTRRQMKRAFNRYYRAQTVLVSGKGGFGIGLCTAREFARAMGGDLTVEPNTPKGCVFTLHLPPCPARASSVCYSKHLEGGFNLVAGLVVAYAPTP
jgi:signal transduction histidine kinase